VKLVSPGCAPHREEIERISSADYDAARERINVNLGPGISDNLSHSGNSVTLVLAINSKYDISDQSRTEAVVVDDNIGLVVCIAPANRDVRPGLSWD
jgi:hypothetical protein